VYERRVDAHRGHGELRERRGWQITGGKRPRANGLPRIVQPSGVEALTALSLHRNPKKERSATIITTAPTI
jgi:hypothetical protein